MSLRPFRFGIQLSRAGTRAEWRDSARRAEELGYDVVSVPDHVGAQLSPFAALLAAGEATSRITLGTFVLDNDFRHPLLMAHEAATVQLLSGGRLELGLGAGWLGRDYHRLGIPFDDPSLRFQRLREAIEIVDRYFRGDPFSFEGAHYEVREAEPLPLPRDLPRPPLLIGGGGPRMLALAGERADVASVFLTSRRDGSGFDADLDAAAYREKVARVRRAGRDVEINVLLQAFEVTDDRDAALAEQARAWGMSPESYQALPFGLAGTIDEIVDDLLARREGFGISYVTVFGEHLETFAPVVDRLRGR